MKKLAGVALGVVAALDLMSATTVYRDATNVTSLVEFLNEDRGSNLMVIRLAKGDYDLTGVEMKSGNHLYLDCRAIVGQGGSPWETRLIGDGTKRILKAKNDVWYDGNRHCRIENLTCTNGYATADGGAVSGYPNVMNCVIIGNRAKQGGGLGGYTYCLDSLVLNNTATAQGGGAYNMNYLRNCVVTGNKAAGGGGVASDNYGSLEGCVISNNVSTAAGGGVQSVRVIKGCRIVGNVSTKQGGGAVSWLTATNAAYKYWNSLVDTTICSNTTEVTNVEGEGGGVYGYHITNCVIMANRARSGGGVSGARDLYDCQILKNTASNIGGGVYNAKVARKCLISENTSAIYGGGAATIAETGWPAIFDSTICSNRVTGTSDAACGGGAYSCYMTNCHVFANIAQHGGGISTGRGIVYDCDIHDNYARGIGGGVHYGTYGNCRIWQNISSGAHGSGYGASLRDCDVSGTGVSGGNALNCVFHDIGGLVVVQNPYIEAATSNTSVWIGIPVATNCLFVNNRQASHWGANKNYAQNLFQGVDNATRSAQIVNCTIVSNTVGQTFHYARTLARPWNVENCVFFGNRSYWGVEDISEYDGTVAVGGIYFKNCAYGSTGGNYFKPMSSFTAAGSELYKFGADGFPAKPGFVYEKDPEDPCPYSLKRTSPLRNRGAYEDWMASATDIRGEGYARATDDHKVDIGCYQCWLPALGSLLLVR